MENCKLNFESSQILVRPLRISDAFDVYRNIRHSEVSKWTGAASHLRSEHPVGQFLSRCGRYLFKAFQVLCLAFYTPKMRQIYRLAIVLKQTNHAIGIVTLTRQKDDQNCADIGFWIGRKFWGQGLMTDAVRLASRFGFEYLKLDRIIGWTFEKNTGSKRVMEKCGFKLESVVENVGFKYGEMQTRLNYSIPRQAFENMPN
jgi:[ribosomal protein S5]-alanine N-acetyltransferase